MPDLVNYENKEFHQYCGTYLQKMALRSNRAISEQLPKADDLQWIRIREKWIKMRAYATGAISLLMEEHTDPSVVFALFSEQGCLLKLYGCPDQIRSLNARGIERKTLWNWENAGPNAVSIGLEQGISLHSVQKENHHPALKDLAIYFAPITQNATRGFQMKTIGGIAVIVPAEAQNPAYEMLVRSVAQTTILHLDMARDIFAVYAQSAQCLLLLDINEQTGQITINHHNYQLFELFQLPQQDLYFKRADTIFDPLPQNEQIWHSIQNDIPLSGQEMMVSVQGKELNCVVTVVHRKRPNVGSRSTLLSLEPFQHSIDTISEKINNHAVMDLENIIGRSPQIRAAVQRAKILANADSNVMIFGESGVGKDLFAQALHNAGKRRGKPFIAVNCGALPRDLIGSELFGYEGGAFTGAKKQGNIGKFELANGGTIFLDEIGELPLDLQATLLRVVEQKKLMRLGGNTMIDVNVKIISATNADIMEMIERKQFRADLYYRLSTVSLNIPPLRARGEDIILLAEHFIRSISERVGKDAPMALSPDTKRLLLSLPWRGNVRELQNLMECIVQLYDIPVIQPNHVLENMAGQPDRYAIYTAQTYRSGEKHALNTHPVPKEPSSRSLLTEEQIMQALQSCDGNRSAAARYLGIARKTFYRNLERLGIDLENA